MVYYQDRPYSVPMDRVALITRINKKNESVRLALNPSLVDGHNILDDNHIPEALIGVRKSGQTATIMNEYNYDGVSHFDLVWVGLKVKVPLERLVGAEDN